MAFIIGIGGGSGAGKTTLANRLKEIYKDNISVIQFDNYCCDQSHLPMEDRVKVNYDIPSSYDGDLLYKHIVNLQHDEPISRPTYCFATHSRTNETVTIEPNKIILVDGIMAFSYPQLFSQYDMRVYVDAIEDTRFERRKRRDIVERGRSEESVTKQFYETVKPMHDIYIEPHKKDVDFVFDNNGNSGLDEVQVTKLVALIEATLSKK